MTKGMTLKSRLTGLTVKVHEVSGDRILVKDDNGKIINHWFDSDSFLRA